MMVESSTTSSIKEIRVRRLFARSVTSHSAAGRCLRVTLARFRGRRSRQVIEETSPMRCRSQPTTRNSSTTIEITRGFRVCFVIVVRTIHRNRPCPAKLHIRLARAVTRNSSQIRQVQFVRFVMRMFRVERSRRLHRCVVSMRDSITRSTQVPPVPLVIAEIVVGLGSQFHRGRMRTSPVLVVTRPEHRQTNETFHHAAPVINSDVSLALRSKRLHTGLVSVTQIMMRLRSWLAAHVIK